MPKLDQNTLNSCEQASVQPWLIKSRLNDADESEQSDADEREENDADETGQEINVEGGIKEGERENFARRYQIAMKR